MGYVESAKEAERLRGSNKRLREQIKQLRERVTVLEEASIDAERKLSYAADQLVVGRQHLSNERRFCCDVLDQAAAIMKAVRVVEGDWRKNESANNRSR